MSSSLGLLCQAMHDIVQSVYARQLSSRSANLPRSGLNGTPFQLLTNRRFSSSPVVLAKRVEKKKAPSKHQLALIAKRKAVKRGKDAYTNEKMTLADAVSVLRVVEVARPESTYELVIRTAMSRGAPIPTGRINLPREAKPRKEYRILVFADGRQADEAKKAGAHVVGGLELVDAVAEGKHNNCTTILCTPSLIRSISSKLGRILGPRGLMPSERRGTVTDDIEGYIQRLQGTTEWRGDKTGTIRMPIGKLYFPIEDVVRNVKQFVLNVKRATGNLKDAVAEAEAKAQKGKNPSKSVKPGAYLVWALRASLVSPSLRPGSLSISPPHLHPFPSCSVLR
ncbi:ribosomal protein L1 [Butyriboletus roseoflavus]|nr:ribosomal protein L1 [Butyriboletus roseoflavus]